MLSSPRDGCLDVVVFRIEVINGLGFDKHGKVFQLRIIIKALSDEDVLFTSPFPV